MINSALVCAAERKRLYWTNIPNVCAPDDKGITLADIALPASDVPEKYWYSDRPFQYNGDDEKIQCTMLGSGFMRNTREVYNLKAKANTLLCDGGGGNRQKKVYQDGRCRKLMPIEYERLQNLPDGYTEGVADCHRYTAVGNGWTVDVISHIFSGLSDCYNHTVEPLRETAKLLVWLTAEDALALRLFLEERNIPFEQAS